MSPFQLELLEESIFQYHAIDSEGKRDYFFKKKAGTLQREFNANWISQATEWNSIMDGLPHPEKKVSELIHRLNGIQTSIPMEQVIRQNRGIFDSVKLLHGENWKIVLRTSQIKRLFFRDKKKIKSFSFHHGGIFLKVKIPSSPAMLEVGEGTTSGQLKFNLEGITQRMNSILKNHRDRKKISFRDKVPVVLSGGDGGILFHEILGHSLEADHIYEKKSPFQISDLNRPVVSPRISILTRDKNDPFFQDIPCDDEGEPFHSPKLIENGILRRIISDYFYKNLLRIKDCGHSRLENFTRIPMPRMYALYVAGGKYFQEELIESVSFGVYAKEFGEGKVYFNKNIFYFDIREAYLIQRGKITYPLGNIRVRGDIREVLDSVEMVGNDFRYDRGVSYCHKKGQTLNVRVGQPSVKINNLWVTKDIND